jgi:amino acid efflux transporter
MVGDQNATDSVGVDSLPRPLPPAARPPATSAPQELSRSISLPHAVALYVGAVLGAGVLILPGVTASRAGGASLVAWALVGLVGLSLALTFSALAIRFPDAGGVATFARRAFGSATGALVGWFYFTAGSVGQTIVTLTGAYYIADAAGYGSAGTYSGVAALLLLFAVAANACGLRASGRVQLVLAAGVAVVLGSVALAAIPRFDLDRLHPFSPHGVNAIGGAAIPLFFAFAGWEAITHLSAEFHTLQDLARATIITVGVVVSLYLGVAFAVVATGTYGSDEIDRVAVARVLGDSLGVSAKATAACAAAVISLGTANAFVAATSRLGYALGRDRALPRAMGRLDHRGVPQVAVLVVGAVGASGLIVSAALGWGAEDLLFIPSSLVLATYIVAMAAGARLLYGRERMLAACGLLLCLAVAPFVGASVLVPVIVAGAAMLFRHSFAVHERR